MDEPNGLQTSSAKTITQFQSKRPLFFIKSKHAFRDYRNHDYFQKLQNEKIFLKGLTPKEFVDGPTPFGIQNAYSYICAELTKNNKQRLNKSMSKRVKTEEANGNGNLQNLRQSRQIEFGVGVKSGSYSRHRLTLPHLASSELNQKSYGSSVKIAKQKMTASDTHLQEPKLNLKPKYQQKIGFTLVDKTHGLVNMHQNQIKIDIIPYLTNTFLKCKAKYTDITEEELSFIKASIIQVNNTPKNKYEYKDLVNLSSLRAIFNHLQQFQRGSPAWVQTVRYFFVSTQSVNDYQFQKVKDEIKLLAGIKFGSSYSHRDIYIFSFQTGFIIKDLYDIIKGNGKFVFGYDRNTMSLFNELKKHRESKEEVAKRLKGWRSIAQPQLNQSQAQSQAQHRFESISVDKYNKLFLKFKQKHGARKRVSTLQKSYQFIDRKQLIKNQQIFE